MTYTIFDKAFGLTMIQEGGYSNHGSDRGGETYRGIARNFHEGWKGWNIVDDYADKSALKHNTTLNVLVKQFYKEKYWDAVKLDRISYMLSDTSLELFDIAVNMGVSTAGKILQRALNILNRDEKIYTDLIVDGKIGNMTLSIVDKYLEKDSEEYIFKLIVLLKAKRYIDIVERNDTQEVFIRGWLNRVKL
jgi:lysozyme family protein